MFGLTKHDLKNIQSKIDYQSDYLDSNFFTTDSGQIKSLRDVSFSANHSVRYYAQLSNKIDTISKHALSDGLSSFFLTMTLDGFYRDLHRGDYSRFDSFSSEHQKEILRLVPKGDVYGNVRKKMKLRKALSIKDLYNILNYQTKRFFMSYAFRKLRKHGKKYMYIRTVEPHKDGVPHFHMMLFIPKEYKEIFMKYFIKSYPAPQNAKSIKGTNDIQGFQSDIKDSSAYIMKYILKSFMDVKNQKEIDYIQAWYIKHRITRCVTSKTLVPQWVYQKVSMFINDWWYLSDMKLDKHHQCEWNKEDNYFHFMDNWSNREIVYQYGLLQIFVNDKKVKEFGEPKEKKEVKKVYDKTPTKWQKPDKPIKVYENGVVISQFVKGSFVPFQKHISDMSDYELFRFYDNYDIDNGSYIYYLATRNLLIDRGLLDSQKYEKYDLNNFDEDGFLSF